MLVIGPLQELGDRDFPGGPVVKAPCTQGRGAGFDRWSGNDLTCYNQVPNAATKDPECHN